MRHGFSVLAGLFFVACVPASSTPVAPPPAGLPNVELVNLDGAATRLPEAMAGRPTLVSLWATWCEACQKEFGPLGKLSDRARAEGGWVVAVDVGEPRAEVARFVKDHGLRYDQLVDEQFHFADALGQRRVPATLVLDGAGAVRHRGGDLDAAALDAFRTVLSMQSTHAGATQ